MPKRRKLILLLACCATVAAMLAWAAKEVVVPRLLPKPIYGCPIGGPPAKAAEGSNYFFAFMGDTRSNVEVLDKIIRAAAADGSAFAIHGGDLVGQCSDAEFEQFYHAVCKATQGRFAIYPVIGNHDLNGFMEGLGDSEFKEFFGPKDYVFWYGSDAFVIFDDVTKGGRFDRASAAMLEERLSAVRGRARNIFLACHVPPFDPDPKGSHCLNGDDAKLLVSVAKKYDVAMILASHVHDYGQKTVEGIPVVVSGGAGALLRPGGQYHWVRVRVDGRHVSAELVNLESAVPQGASEPQGR